MLIKFLIILLVILAIWDMNNMVDLVERPIMQEYSRYMTEDEIKTDMVKTIQNRIMGMNEKTRNELGITEDFLDDRNIFDMINDKKIRFVYDKTSSATRPTYYIKADLDGSGLYYDIPNPNNETSTYAPYDFSGKKPDYLESSPDKIREQAYLDEWNSGFEERKKGYDRRGLGSTRRAIADFTRFNLFKIQNDIHAFGKEQAENIASLIPGLDYNYDNWEEQSQKVLKRINESEESNRKLGLQNTDIMFNFIFDMEESGKFKPEAYETEVGNNDWTIGMGLSLNDETVKKELINKGYNINKLIKKENKIKYEDSKEIFDIKINEAKKIAIQKMKNLGNNITGIKNSYLIMALTDMQFQGSYLGPAFTQALSNYIKTGNEKYLGTFSSYTKDGIALRKNEKGYKEREVSVLGELYNDGIAAQQDGKGGIFLRNQKRSDLILSWSNGQYTNLIKE